MAKSLCHLLLNVNYVIVANFYVANMYFHAICENKILAKISEFTVTASALSSVVCLFVCFTSHVNSNGHVGTVSSESLNHTFSWAGLSKRLTSNLCTYFRL